VRSSFLLDCPYAFIDDKDLVLAVRMMPGGDLSYYLKERKEAGTPGLGPAAVQFYIASTVLGLQALHGAGFLYRDLKDKNILLDGLGHARLCDFGLSADVTESSCSGSTGTKVRRPFRKCSRNRQWQPPLPPHNAFCACARCAGLLGS
jgi:protein-serine/threonine kinase